MAWENWSKRNIPKGNNNDEPAFEPIDAKGVLDNDDHSYFGAKAHNGFIRIPKNQLYNIAGALGAAARSDSHVMTELYDELPEDSNLWDALGGKLGRAGAEVAMQDVNDTKIRPTVNSSLYDASRAVEGVAKALPKEWESNVDESSLPYWQQIAGGVVENAPSLAANAAMYAVNPLVGTAFMMGDIAGGTTADLSQKGVDIGDAWQAGALNAAAQEPLELVGASTIANMFKGVTPNAVAKIGSLPILKSLKGKDANSIRNAIGAAFVNEGIPEMAQEIPDEVISYIAEHGSMEGFNYGELASNMVDAGLVGGVTGGMLATPGAIANRFRTPKDPNVVHADATIENGESQPAPSDDNGVVTIDAEPTDTVGSLLNAIGGQETGGEDDQYGAYNADGDAHGKYQITSDTWAANAEAAGVDPSEGMTPENQEKVARYMMDQYVQKYGEDGAIIAWYAGEGTAQAYVDGTLSEEAFTRKQGDNGEYPSIKEYLESVQARRGQGGATQTTRSTSQRTNEPQPKSAAEFLEDIESTMPLDTEEQQAENDRVHKTITQGTKDEQDALAREYGWNSEPAQNVTISEEDNGQENTPPAHANASRPQNNAPQVKTNPIETKGTDTSQSGKPTNIKPVYNPGRNTAANGNGNNATYTGKQNNAPVVGRRNTFPQNSMGIYNRYPQEPSKPLYEQRETNGIAGHQRQDRWENTNRTDSRQAQRISKALSNSKFKGLVKQAFVDGDASAQNRINAMNINPEVLEAVKGTVIPNYVPQGITSDPNFIPASGQAQGTSTPTTNPTTNGTTTATPTENVTNTVPQNGKGNTVGRKGNTVGRKGNTPKKRNPHAESGKSLPSESHNGNENTQNTTPNTPEKRNDTPEKRNDNKEPSQTSNSNTEEQTNESTNPEKIRKLLSETDNNKDGNATSKEGIEPESKGSTPTKTENTINKPGDNGEDAKAETPVFESPFDISDEADAQNLADLQEAFGFNQGEPEDQKGTEVKDAQSEPANNEEENNIIEGQVLFEGESDDLHAELEKWKKAFEAALEKSAHRLNSNPIFDPDIWVPAFHLGATYLKLGAKSLSDFRRRVVADMGDKIKPWVKSVWEALQKAPKGVKLSDKQLTIAIRFAGTKYFREAAKGNDYTLEQLQADFKKAAVTEEAYNKFKDILPMVHAAVANYQKENGEAKPVNESTASKDNSGTIKAERSDVAPKEDKDVSRGVSRPSRPVEMGRSGESGTDGKGKGKDSGGNRTDQNRTGRSEYAGNTGDNESSSKSKVQGRSKGVGTSDGVEQDVGNGNETGRIEQPVISKKADKIEADIASGKVEDARDVPGNTYTLKPINEITNQEERVKKNIEAIKLLKKIESENRKATPAEQEILASYSGWGSLTFAIDEKLAKYNKEIADEIKSLLTVEELKDIRGELTTAYYTPHNVVKAMWTIAEKLGFKGGRVLDPSCGTGNFFGLMPASVRAKCTTMQGIDKSSLPARIAAQLYQGKNIRIDNMGYEDFKTGNEFYDLAITNVPFVDTVIADKTIKNKYKLHNYFFAKTLQKVRPGGLIMFMTSSTTMDRGGDAEKLRGELADKTELVGVIRMPSSLFNNAGAKVTTDVIVLRKLNEGEHPTTDSWKDYVEERDSSWYYTTVDAKTGEVNEVYAYANVNKYFSDHAGNVIGVPTESKNRYGRTTDIVVKDDKDMSERLSKAISDFPAGIYIPRVTGPTNSVPHVREVIDAGKIDKNKIVGNITKTKDGKYGQVVQDKTNGEIYIKPYKDEEQVRIGETLNVRDALDDLLTSQVDPNATDFEIEAKRAKLNDLYDAFKKKYGCLNDFANTSLLGDVPQIGRLLALEDYTPPEPPKKTAKSKVTSAQRKSAKGTAKKAGIFTQRTAYPPNQKIKITTSADALLASLQDHGYVDLDFMSKALGKSEEEIIKELDGKIMKDPVKEQWVPRDEYLSGNVRRKLAFAEDAARTDPTYEKNVEELKKIIPKDLKIQDIDIPLGSPVLVPEDVQAFIDDLVGVNNAIKVSFNPTTAKWKVERGPMYHLITDQTAYTKYGVESITRDDTGIHVGRVIESMLDGTDLSGSKLFKQDKDDTKETIEKREKAKLKATAVKKAINERLTNWILADKERAKKIETAYNNVFNATVLRKYDGSFLRLPWLNAAGNISLRPHQANAVWRTLNERATLYAHCVGSGKTWTMQSAGMELKRLGLAHKIVYTVPKNVVKQFEREFYQICPNAKILVLDSSTLPAAPKSIDTEMRPVMKNGKVLKVKGKKVMEEVKLTPEEIAGRKAIIARRNATMMKIKTNDWDAIIMSHDTFENLPVADNYLKQFLDNELAKYKHALESARRDNGSKASLRDMQKSIDALQARLNELLNRKEKMNLGSDTFETLGIDQLFVDEADKFKNLQFATSMGNIKGISNSYSARAEDMYLKTQYLLHSPNTHGVVFATGTPISNSVVELYTMCRYMAGDELERLGINSFDQFAKMFIRFEEGEVPKQDGTGYEYRNIVQGLRNAPECARLFRQFADVEMVDDLPYIAEARPKCTYEQVVIPEPAWLKKFKRSIRERVKLFNSSDPPMRESRSQKAQEIFERTGERTVVKDGYLLLSADFKDATLCPHIVDKSVTGEEGFGKVWACAEKVHKEWEESSDRNGAQLVFCDSSTPSKNPKWFSVYNELKNRLMELGIPEEEIAFVHDADTDEKQAKLFQAVNKGEIRVLIGSTEKMGAGTNMQKKLVASHHLDCPWRPRDIEQRDGRILRQGNENKNVRIYKYVTEGSYDSNLWNILKNKANIIHQVMHGDPNVRVADTEGVDASNFAEMEKMANADPDQKRYLETTARLRELESAKTAFENSQKQAKAVMATAPGQLESTESTLKEVQEDIDALKKTDPKKFNITIDGKTYDKREEANEAVTKAKDSLALDWARYLHKAGNQASLTPVKIGTVRGFDIYASGDNRLFRNGQNSANIELTLKRNVEYSTSTPTALGAWNAVQTEPSRFAAELKNEAEKLRRDIKEAKESASQTFANDDEIEALTKETAELKKRIDEKAAKQAEEDRLAAERESATLIDSEYLKREADALTFDDDADYSDLFKHAFAETYAKRTGQSIRAVEGRIPAGEETSIALAKIPGWEDMVADIKDRTNWKVEEQGDRVIVAAKGEDVEQFSSEEHYLATDEKTRSFAKEEMKAQVMSNFPNAQNIVEHENGISFDLPNGLHVEANFTDDTIAIDWDKAQADYGGNLTGKEKALGRLETVDRDAIITLTKDSVEEVPSHEAMHLAMGLLNEKERTALFKKYGNEEAICEGMREWKIRRNEGKGTSMGKIMQKISDIAYKLLGLLKETDHNIFRKLESGELWEREVDNKAAAHVSYLINPANNIKDYLNQAGDAAYGKYEKKFKPEVHAAKQNPHIMKSEKGKESGWSAGQWLANNTLQSPSRIKSFATKRIHDLADTANRKMNKLYGDWTNSFARAIQGMSEEEKTKLTDILWNEDANQKVYTDNELKDMGCSDKVIRAHKKTRNLLHKIYTAVNDVYTGTKVENHVYASLKNAQKAQKEFAKRPHTEVFHDIKEINVGGKKQYQVSVRTVGYHKSSMNLTEDEIEKEIKQNKDRYLVKSEPILNEEGEQIKNEAGKPLFNVSFLEYNKPLTDMEGYVPHIFHGIMIIRSYTDANGNRHSEVVGSADNMDKAVVEADKLQQELGGEFLLAPKQFNSEGEVENPLFLGDKEYKALMDNLKDSMTLSLEEAREATQARTKGRHVSYSALKKRKGAKGFETNAIWAIQHHIGSSARYVALDPFKSKAINLFERAFGDFDDDWAGKNREAEWIKGYIDSMLGKPGVLEKVANSFLKLFPMFKNESRPAQHLASTLTGLTGVLKLGASPAAGFVNMLQILNCVGYVGARKTAVGIKRAMHLTSQDIRILKMAGADDEVGLAFDGIGKIPLEQEKYSKTLERINNLREKVMLPFTLAERTIRRATILAAYYDFIEKNKGRYQNPSDLKQKAIAHAIEINRKVNFDYSMADSPRIFRAVQGTVLGDIALQFQKYGVKELEAIGDFLPILGKETSTKQKVEFFVPYLLVSGLWNALPFEDAILALLGMLFGIDDPEKEAKKAMIEWAGADPTKKAMVDVANYGAGSIVGMDISQRVGLKGITPDTSNILKGGPTGSTAIQLSQAILNGDVNAGMKAVSPAMGNIYGAAIGYNTDSKGRKTVDYDNWDRAMRALGFRTTREARATDAQSIVYNYKETKKKDRAKAKEAYFKEPSAANYEKLLDLGYTRKEIKNLKNDKQTTRTERSETGLSKDDKKKLDAVLHMAN